MSEAAIAPLRRAIAIEPGYKTSWQNLLMALTNLERWDDAHQASRDALRALPDAPELASSGDWIDLRRARLLAERGEWALAANLYACVVAGHYRDDGEVWFELACARLLRGDVEGYKTTCRAMLTRTELPALRGFLVARACTLSPLSRDELRRAAEIGSAELESAAQLSWLLTVQGAVAYRMGDAQTASAKFEHSIAVAPTEDGAPTNWCWLALARSQQGDAAGAASALQTAVTWFANHPSKPDAIHLHDWLEAIIMVREANRSIGSDSTK